MIVPVKKKIAFPKTSVQVS